jgi:hypothetical protein
VIRRSAQVTCQKIPADQGSTDPGQPVPTDHTESRYQFLIFTIPAGHTCVYSCGLVTYACLFFFYLQNADETRNHLIA